MKNFVVFLTTTTDNNNNNEWSKLVKVCKESRILYRLVCDWLNHESNIMTAGWYQGPKNQKLITETLYTRTHACGFSDCWIGDPYTFVYSSCYYCGGPNETNAHTGEFYSKKKLEKKFSLVEETINK